jgi:hypothetical protein
MNRRRAWLKRGLYVAGVSFAISGLTTGLLLAAMREWIVLSPPVWVGVRGLVILAWLCFVASIGLFVWVLTLKVRELVGGGAGE